MIAVESIGNRSGRGVVELATRARGRWLDPYLAVGFGIALEIEVFTSAHRRGPLALNALAVAVMAAAAIWRRRFPLLFLAVVGVAAVALSRGLASASTSYGTLTGLYVVLFPTYTVAAWEKRDRALIGFAAWIGFAGVAGAVQHAHVSAFVPGTLTAVVAWSAGRVMYAQRALAGRLERDLARLAAEREDRASLAAAGERMRIARELHAVVARSVVGMVVEAEAAECLLDRQDSTADEALLGVENAGRSALVEMRRILGVLRRPDEGRDLQPQPGIDQLDGLIERAREVGLPVDVEIAGEPGVLPVIVNLAVYRIVEEALDSAREGGCRSVSLVLHFGEQGLVLRIAGQPRPPGSWPTTSMRERIGLCGGELRVDQNGRAGNLTVRLPRQPHGGSL